MPEVAFGILDRAAMPDKENATPNHNTTPNRTLAKTRPPLETQNDHQEQSEYFSMVEKGVLLHWVKNLLNNNGKDSTFLNSDLNLRLSGQTVEEYVVHEAINIISFLDAGVLSVKQVSEVAVGASNNTIPTSNLVLFQVHDCMLVNRTPTAVIPNRDPPPQRKSEVKHAKKSASGCIKTHSQWAATAAE